MEYLIEDDSVFKQSGIYQIRNKITNQVYIGSAVKINKRYYQHKSKLKNKSHTNSYLQNSVDVYGIENFVFEILQSFESIEYSKLLEIEEQIIGETWENNYNYMKSTEICLYGRTPGSTTPEEVRQKISKGVKETFADMKENNPEKYNRVFNQTGENNGMYGKTHSEETRRKIGEKSKGRIQPTKRCMIDGVIYNSGKHAAKILGIPHSTVTWRLRNKNFKTYIKLKDIQD